MRIIDVGERFMRQSLRIKSGGIARAHLFGKFASEKRRSKKWRNQSVFFRAKFIPVFRGKKNASKKKI